MPSMTSDLITRLQRTVSSIGLDRQSRATLDEAFDRFAVLERRREVRTAIAAARTQRDRIARFLELLVELDELDEREQDNSVFAEAAVLFEEIARCAAEGAIATDTIAALPPEPCISSVTNDASSTGAPEHSVCGKCSRPK